MENILLPEHLIDRQHTLVIACPECRKYLAEDQLVSVYFCLGGMLRRQDQLQREFIQHHVEENHCSRIIIAGHYCCQIVERIRNDHANNISSPYILEWKTDALLHNHPRNFLRNEISNQMTTEINVLDQLHVLTSFDFIKSKLDTCALEISGVVIDEERLKVKEIFRNGIMFNDLISAN